MKLLYIEQYFCFPDEVGGTRAYDLASSFVKKGISVTVLTTNTKGNQKSKWLYKERDGIKLYYLNCPYSNKMGFYRRILAFVNYFVNATFKAMTIDYDVMLATSTPLTVGIPALVTYCLRRKPYVFEVRDVWPGVPIAMGYFKNKWIQKCLYAFEKTIYRYAKFIVPLSIGMDENIKQRYPNRKSIVIPNLSAVDRFAKIIPDPTITVPEGKRVVLYAGTIGNVNGISYVVKLAQETLALDPNLWYYIIGNGKEKDAILVEAEQRGVLNNNFFVFDPVKKDELPYLYSIATVGSSFVIDLPALWDNSANKFFDTLAAHKPMVINHRGWQAKVIENNNLGYVLPPFMDKKIAMDFVDYMNNESLLKQQGENAYSHAVKDYSIDIAVNKYLNIFNEIVIE